MTSITLRKTQHNTSLYCSSSIFSLNQFIYSSSYKINSSILIILIKYKWKDSSKNSNYSTYYKCIEILHSGWWKKFGDIHANFYYFFEDFLVPYFIQGVKCFFFNLILATGKHSSYSESIMLKKINCRFCNLNWTENLCLYISFFIASSFSAIYLYQKKTGKWSEMSVFIIPDLKPMYII